MVHSQLFAIPHAEHIIENDSWQQEPDGNPACPVGERILFYTPGVIAPESDID